MKTIVILARGVFARAQRAFDYDVSRMKIMVSRVCALAYGLWALTVVAQVLDIVSIMADLPPVMGDIMANLGVSAWFSEFVRIHRRSHRYVG